MGQGDAAGIRVFLIAEQEILLWGLQQLIKGNRPAMLLTGCAKRCADALPLLDASAPDIILLDLDLRDEKVSDLIPPLVASSRARIIAMTRCDDKILQDQAILNGARGILDKHATAEVFLEAISKVHLGQLWLDRAATGRIFVEFSRRGTPTADPEQARLDALTEREKSIVRCIFDNSGASAKAIAEKLHISESTLRNHLTSIYGKLGIANRFELVSYAMKKGRNLVFS
jgi:two-component system, NarL family, nitrate/nitrite response regulator NarL